MTDPRHLLVHAMDGFGERLARVPADGWDAPTPCEGWTVRDLVSHVVEEERWAPPLLAGEAPEDIAGRLGDDHLGDDPVAAWRAAASAVEAAVSHEVVLDAVVDLPAGATTGREFLHELFADHLVHTWDLARAVDADERLDPGLVEICAAWFDAHEQAWRDGGQIGPPAAVPDDADNQTRLLSRFGRDARTTAAP